MKSHDTEHKPAISPERRQALVDKLTDLFLGWASAGWLEGEYGDANEGKMVPEARADAEEFLREVFGEPS